MNKKLIILIAAVVTIAIVVVLILTLGGGKGDGVTVDALAAEKFGVGYAPNSFDSLSKYLTGKGFTLPELIEAGLLSQGDRGSYDRFRGRLVWPIRDVSGQTIGFGA